MSTVKTTTMQTQSVKPKALQLSIRKAAAKLNDLLKKAGNSGIPVAISPENTITTDDMMPVTKSVRVIIYPACKFD